MKKYWSVIVLGFGFLLVLIGFVDLGFGENVVVDHGGSGSVVVSHGGSGTAIFDQAAVEGGGSELVLVSSVTTIATAIDSSTTSFNAGTSDLIVVTVGVRTNAAQQVKDVQWNGQLLTLSTRTIVTGCREELFYLAGGASGTNNLVVTMAANASVGYSILSFSGADQTTPISDPQVAATAGGTSTTLSVTSETGDIVVDSICTRPLADTTMDGGQTNITNSAVSTIHRHGVSHKDGSASTSMTWTHANDGSNRNMLGVNVNAAP